MQKKKDVLRIDWNNPEHLIFIIIALGILFLLALFILQKNKAKDEEQIVQDMGQVLYCKILKLSQEAKSIEPQKGPTVNGKIRRRQNLHCKYVY